MSDAGMQSPSWLVRTHQNVITGPFVKQDVAKLILSGKLALNDEVCSSGGYWIYLSEREEIAKYLGVQVPFDAIQKEETTETAAIKEALTREIERPFSSSVMASESMRSVPPPLPEHYRVTEKPAIYRMLTWLMLGGAAYLVYRVFQILSR